MSRSTAQEFPLDREGLPLAWPAPTGGYVTLMRDEADRTRDYGEDLR